MPHPTVGNFVNKEKCAPLGSFGIWASPYALSWQPLIARNYLLNFRCAFCLILYIKWNLVVRGRRFLCTYSTVLQICCTCAVNKNTWRTTGTRRDEGTRTTGTWRALAHGHLKTAHWGSKSKRLLLRSKHIAPKPRIARALELVYYRGQFQLPNTYTFLCTLSSSSELAQGTKNLLLNVMNMNQDGDRYCNEHGLVKIWDTSTDE